MAIVFNKPIEAKNLKVRALEAGVTTTFSNDVITFKSNAFLNSEKGETIFIQAIVENYDWNELRAKDCKFRL